MKKELLSKALFVCFFITNITFNYSQSTGDIAFIAYNADTDDDFAFVTLVDIAANTTIWFTDNEWDGTSFNNLNEGEIQWSHSSLVPAGSIIEIKGNTGSSASITNGPGIVSGSGMNLGASNETIFALLTEPSISTMSSPNFLAGFSNDFDGDTSNTLTGTGLTSGVNFIDFDNDHDGFKYTGTNSGESSFSDYLPLIMTIANWQDETSTGDNILPISTTSFTVTQPTTWSGATDNDWATAGNWSNGVPTISTTTTIPSGLSNYPTISTGTTASSKTIAMASGTSLIASGTATLSGDITYTRSGLGTTAWHLLSPPVVGETIEDVINSTSLTTGTVSSSNLGLSTYNNSTPAWQYYTSSSTGTMPSGAGYAVLVTSGDVSFTGTLQTADVAAATSLGSNGWNLIGNPYPSYIAVNNSADATNRLMGSISSLDTNYASIYFWDAATATYVPENNGTDARYVAPGQGFFVKVNSGVSSITITEAMQSHQSSEEFSRTVDRTPKVTLSVTTAESIKTTTVRYFESANTGLDVGYDAGAFNGGYESDFALNTHLVSDSQGIDFTAQALSIEGYETNIVPISFTAAAGTAMVFTSTAENLPEGMMVFLEDRQVNVFTRLDEVGTNYTTTLAANEAGIGRFYLHTSVENRLGVDTIDFANVSIYATDANTVRVTGLTASHAKIQIFDVLGRQLLDQRFEADMVNDIAVPNLVKANVYLVRVSSAKGSITKKIVCN